MSKHCIKSFYDEDTKLFVIFSGKAVHGPQILLQARVPRTLVYSMTHAAKAAETALMAIRYEKSLRNKELELLRRLTARRQVKELEELLEKTRGKRCYLIVSREIPREIQCCRMGGKSAVKILFPKLLDINPSSIDDAIVSTIALTFIDKWYK
jgi:hypothetical protein